MLTPRIPALVGALQHPVEPAAVNRAVLQSTIHCLLSSGRASEAARLLDLSGAEHILYLTQHAV